MNTTIPSTGATTATTAEFELHLAEQVRLTREIIDMMVGIDVVAANDVWPPQDEVVAAEVRFQGAWPGAMIFACSVPLALHFTSQFMSVPLPESVDADVRDALGELANMIAGNFKPLLPPGTSLSIPHVLLEDQSAHSHTGFALLCQTVFQTSFGNCCVKLAGGHTHT